ncbi:MAG: hypothetical protein LBF16_15315 [Pseudomonadales bacterium]|jgi:hypothetical protein|nr:hypothetical protein [Pseudomonadales bacterium]
MQALNSVVRLGQALAGLAFTCVCIAPAMAQVPSGNNPAQALAMQQRAVPASVPGINLFPTLSFDTLVSIDYAHMSSNTGPSRGPGFVFWSDSTLQIEFDEELSLTGLLQIKPREPLPEDNPNNELFINRGLNRREGGMMKELYLRYGDWRVGKFVQGFGRGYAMLPGPYSSDFTEEPEAYEPSSMVGIEKVHVFDDETSGWRQLTLSAFMVDRTFLHQSFGYNEGWIRYSEGGVGNTRLPENLMATYDVMGQPLGNWGSLSYQAGLIRWGKPVDAEKSEWWTTLGGDITVPLTSGVADTLRGEYSQLMFYVEGVRRDNFEGISGRTRSFLSGAAEYMTGNWVFDLTTTQRWTNGSDLPNQRDTLYSASIGYNLPSQINIAFSGAREQVGDQSGVYVGIRFTQAFTNCSKCMMKGLSY